MFSPRVQIRKDILWPVWPLWRLEVEVYWAKKKGIEKVCGRYYALMDAIFSIIFDPAVIRSQKSIVHTIRRLPM